MRHFVLKLKSKDTDGYIRHYSVRAQGETKGDAIHKAMMADCFGEVRESQMTVHSGLINGVEEADGRVVSVRECIEVNSVTYNMLGQYL